MGNGLNITFPGNLAQVDTVAELRAVPTSFVNDGYLYVALELEGVFAFEAGSIAADDAVSVIKPNDRSFLQAGRWVKKADGFARGPAGPADNTYTSRAALQASDIARKAASLVGDPVAPDGRYFWTAGNFTALANDLTILPSTNTPVSQGAWVKSVPFVSVRDFGAKGDGSTDDSGAVSLAIAAAQSNSTIVFPSSTGEYVLASQVLVQGRRNLNFLGQGARIKGGSTRVKSYLKFLNCQRISVTGITFDQLQPSLPVYTQADYANGWYNVAIEIEGGSRFSVSGCCFDNLYTRAVTVYLATDVDVSGNVFTSLVQNQTFNGTLAIQEGQHIHFATSSGVRAANNRFINSAITNPALGVCSVYASGISGYAIIEGNYSVYAGRDNTGTHRLGVIDFYGDAQAVRITNNVSVACMAQFARVSSTRGAIVAGNRIEASPNAELDYSMLTLEGNIGFVGGQIGILDNIVRDNLFIDSAHRHAFTIGILAYDWGTPSLRTLVTANTFEGCRISVLARGPQYDTAIIGNSMRGQAAGAIMVDQQTAITAINGSEANSIFRSVRVEGNTILNELANSSTSGITINLSKTPAYTGSIDHIAASNNVVRSANTNGGQGISVNLGASTQGHARVERNEFVNYAIGIYLRQALIHTVRGNRMASCPTPVLDDQTAGTVDRDWNRYSSGSRKGRAQLNAGGVVVNTPEVRTGDSIRLTRQTASGAPGHLAISAISDGASFTITSSDPGDTSTILWEVSH